MIWFLIILSLSEVPTQTEVLESAWKRLPELESMRLQGQALEYASGISFFDSAELQFDYQSEDAASMPAEWEFGADLPLATPKVRAIQKRLMGAYLEIGQKHGQYLKWRLAGSLQTMYWDYKLLLVKQRQIELAMLDSDQQKRWLTELVQLGERSNDELNQAKQQWVLDQFQYQEIQQELAAKVRAWEQVTGYSEFPETWTTPVVNGRFAELDDNQHPYLGYLGLQLKVLEQEMQREKMVRSAPKVNLGVKHVEGILGSDSGTAWKVGFSYPLDSKPVGTLRSSYSEMGELKSQLVTVKRSISLKMDQLQAAMDSNQLQLDLLDPMAEDMENQFDMRRQAFREGLITVLEWQQIRQLHRRFRQQLGQAKIRQSALQAEYSHTAGVMP